MDELNPYELASHLTKVTGVKWEVPSVSRLNDDYTEVSCYTFPGLLSVIVRRGKDGGNVILWRYGLSISHPEGRTSEHKDEPYIYITDGGTADIAAGLAQIGTAQAETLVHEIMNQPTRFTTSEANEFCPKLLMIYEKAIVGINGGLPISVITTLSAQATEARSLAYAGGCSLDPFVNAFLKRTK